MRNIDELIEEIDEQLMNNYDDDMFSEPWTYAEVYLNDNKTFRIDMFRNIAECEIYDLKKHKHYKNLLKTAMAQKAISEFRKFEDIEIDALYERAERWSKPF